MEIIERKPSELKNHPLNIKIYGGHIDDAFKQSIQDHGIQSPLTVCKSSNPDLNDVVVKGRRRRMAAVMLDLKTVPCIEWECDDPLEFEEKMIVDNIRNDTTVEERARMFEELKRIESAKAERRKQATQKRGPTPVREKFPAPENIGENAEKGRSADKAASSVGMSGKTAEKASKIVHVADELREAGETEAADEIIETLNTKSVAAAERKAAEAVAPPTPPSDDANHSRDIDRHTAKITAACAQLEKSAGELFVAIDQKKKTSPAFANRHAKFAGYIRKLVSLLEPLQQQAGVMQTAWNATKKQVDEV